MSRSRAGFTLLELMIAVAIAILILTIAVPSVSGMMAERRLHATFEKFDDLTRKAQLNAVKEQRSWVLVWQPGGILVQPNEPTPEERMAQEGLGEEGATGDTFTFGENETYELQRPAALLPAKDVPSDWTFWRSGTCEPVVVNYQGPDGWWTAQYNPLTGRGEIIEQGVK